MQTTQSKYCCVISRNTAVKPKLILSQLNFVHRLVRVPKLEKHRHITHPMREGVKQKHFSTLSVRPRSVLASRPLLRGEDFGFNAWSVTECDRYMDRSC